MANTNIRKIEFNGVFGIDGVSGGDVYPHWEVNIETYKQVKKQIRGKTPEIDKDEILPNGKIKLFMNELVDLKDEGKKQKIKVVISE